MGLGSGNPIDIARVDTGACRFDLTIALNALFSRLLQAGSLLPGFLMIPSTSEKYKL